MRRAAAALACAALASASIVAPARAAALSEGVDVRLLDTWTGGGPSVAVTVEAAGSSTVRGAAVIDVTLRWYVSQSDTEKNFALEALPTPVSTPAATCAAMPYLASADALADAAGFACVLAGCRQQPRDSVPTVVAQAASSTTVAWLQYVVRVLCTPGDNTGSTMELKLAYALSYGAQLATSAASPPYVALQLQYVPPSVTNNITVVLAMQATQSPDPAEGAVAFGFPVSVRFALEDSGAQAAWYVAPLAIVLVAQATAPTSVAAPTQAVAAGAPADEAWCGVGADDVLAASSLVALTNDTAALLPPALAAALAALPAAFAPASDVFVGWQDDGSLVVNVTNGLAGATGATVQVCALLEARLVTALAAGGYYPLFPTAPAVGAARPVVVDGVTYFWATDAPVVCRPGDACAAAPARRRRGRSLQSTALSDLTDGALGSAQQTAEWAPADVAPPASALALAVGGALLGAAWFAALCVSLAA